LFIKCTYEKKKIFYENGALEALIGLFNNEACPDHQHVLETILTLSNAKPNAMSILAERDSLLMEQFHQKLNERYQVIQSSEDQQDEIDLINQLRTLIISSPSENVAEPPTTTTTTTDKQIVSTS